MIKKEKKNLDTIVSDSKLYLDDIENLLEILKKRDLAIEISDTGNLPSEIIFRIISIV